MAYVCTKCRMIEHLDTSTYTASSSTSSRSTFDTETSVTSTPSRPGTAASNNPSRYSKSPVERVKRNEYERQRANSEDATACFMTPISVPLSSTSASLAAFSSSLESNRSGVSSTLIENVMRHLRLLNERRSELTELDLLREMTMLLTGHRYSSPAGRLGDDNSIQNNADDSCVQLDQDVRNWLETEMNPLQLSSRSADNSDCLTDNERDDHEVTKPARRTSVSGRSISASTPRSASRTINPSRLLSGRRLSSKRSVFPIITNSSMLSLGTNSNLPASQTAPILSYSPTLSRNGSMAFHDLDHNSNSTNISHQPSTPASHKSMHSLTFQFNVSSPNDEPVSVTPSSVPSPIILSIPGDSTEISLPYIDLRHSPSSHTGDIVVSRALSPASRTEESRPSHTPSASPCSPIFVMRVTSHEGIEAETAIKLPLTSASSDSGSTASSSPTHNANSSNPSPNLSISLSCDSPITLLPDMSSATTSALDTLAIRRPYYSDTLNKLEYWLDLLNEERTPKSAPCLYDEDGDSSEDENNQLVVPIATIVTSHNSHQGTQTNHAIPQIQGSSKQYSISFNIPDPIADALDAALHIAWNSLNDWSHFDIFHLAETTNRWPLSFMFLMVCQKHGLFASLHLNPSITFRFIQEVEAGYLNNPYHTSTHAADVLHALYIQITETFLFTKLTDIEKLALFIGAAIHDYAHPGVNNAFLINQSHPLALTYNDRSVLESYHIAQVFHMMDRVPHANILCGFSRTDQKKIRKIIIDCVMATDLAYHFDLLAQMKSKIQLSLDYDFEGDRSLLMQMCLKCADISHPSRSRYLHIQWAELLTEEFFLQGDREKRAGMPPSMFMDRSNAALGRSQIGFISVFVLPLYREMGAFLQRDMWSKQVEDNLLVWQEVHKEEERERENSSQILPVDDDDTASNSQSSAVTLTAASPKSSPNLPESQPTSARRRASIASPKSMSSFSFPYLSAQSSSQSSSKMISSPLSRLSFGSFPFGHRASVSSSPGRPSRRNRASESRRSLSADGRRRAHSLWASFNSMQNASTTQLPAANTDDIVSPANTSLSPHMLSVPTPSRYLSLRTRDMFHRVRQISESTCSSYTSSPAVSPLSTSPLPSPLGCATYRHGLRVISWR